MEYRERLLIAAAFTTLITAVVAPGQTTSPKDKKNAGPPDSGLVLHLNVRRVPVDVVVLNKKGDVVRGLRKEDFSIKEDGKTQQVLSFDWLDGARLSPVPAKLPELPPNTFMNASTVPERGPLYVLYYDLVNTSPVQQMAFRHDLLTFVDNAPPGTRIALFVNAQKLQLLQGFTTDHELLREAILRKGPGPHIPPVFIYGEVYGLEDIGAALSNLNFMAEYLQGIPGRKNLLWLSGNFPIPEGPAVVSGGQGAAADGGAPQVRDWTELEAGAVKQTYTAMMRSQIALYPISVTGVAANALGAEADNLVDFQHMDDMARQTGGHAYYSNNRVYELIDKAVEHGESYYTLSYAPTNDKYDGSERHIEVKLARHPDYTVTYRTGYYALSDVQQQEHKKEPTQTRFLAAKFTDTLYANIEHGAPILHDLLFSAHLAADGAPHLATADEMQALEDSPEYFKTHQKHPQKALPPVKLQKYVIDYGVIDPQLRAAVAHKQNPSPLEFAAAAYDDDGRLLNSMLNQGLPSGNGGKQEALFHAVQELQVPPGAAFLRMAVRDTMTNRTGTLEVRLPLQPETTASAVTPAKGAEIP